MRSRKFEVIREGLTIRGRVFGIEEGVKKPAVILSHGFTDNHRGVRRYAVSLAEKGFITFIFDFCGGGIICASDGRNEDMTVETEVKDLLSVIEYARGLEYVDADRVSLCGFSQGGYVSGITAARVSEKIRCLILFFPALCIPDDARRGQMISYVFDPANIPDLIGEKPMRLGGVYAKCVLNADPYEEIKGYEGPVMIIHGTDDTVVNISYSQKAASVYKNCRFDVIPGGGHGFGGAKDKKARGLMLEFAEVNA